MTDYFVGDIHGCYDELISILKKINFNLENDMLWLTGDLMFKGPKSLEVLRLVRNLSDNVKIVLGNHDLIFLSKYFLTINNRYCIKQDLYFYDLFIKLHSTEEDLIHWLRYQPILRIDDDKKILMVHAGLSPQWKNIYDIRLYAREVELVLRGEHYISFLEYILFNKDNFDSFWNSNLHGFSRLQFIVNVFTRIRYCFYNGKLDFSYTCHPKLSPCFLYPWFLFYKNTKYKIIFGHWSSLMGECNLNNFYALDTGCCWGNYLTVLNWKNKKIVKIISSCKKNKYFL